MACSYLAKRFQHLQASFALNTEALAKFSDIIDLSIGDPDLITNAQVIDAACRDAHAGYTRYGDPQGDPALRQAIAQAWQADYAQTLTQEEILVTSSSSVAMVLALTAILNPGDEVIVFSPCFPVYRQQIELVGGVCVEVPTYAAEGFALSAQRLQEAITPRTRAMIFNNPCNPSGKVYTMAEYDIIARAAQQHRLLVLADEIYTSYLFSGSFVPFRTLPDMAARTVTLKSFSKDYLMSGWRIGYAIAPPELLQAMQYINSALIYTAPAPSQRAALAALQRRKELRQNNAVFLQRSAYATARIRNIPYLDLVAPQGTFYLFPDAKRTGLSSQAFCQTLLTQAHILVSPGHVFGCTGQGHFRIACTVGMDALQAAFDRMEQLKF